MPGDLRHLPSAAVAPEVLCTLALPKPFPALVSDAATLRTAGHLMSRDELVSELRERPVDVLCPQLREAVDGIVLDAGGSRLRCVSLFAVGFNNVDVDAATERGVVVANTPGVLTNATADCAMGLMLAAARNLCEGDREVRAGRFAGWEPEYLLGQDVSGALLGVIGFGRIGQAVARRALGFSMRVVYFDSTDPPVAEDLQGRVSPTPLDTLLREADVITLHTPLTEETHHLIDEPALRTMKDSAILVNTSRGPVIDEAALAEALRNGEIFGAGLDVFEKEPEVHPALLDLDNAVIVPHLGSATVATRDAMGMLAAENLFAGLEERRPPTPLNPEVWEEARGSRPSPSGG